MGTKDRGQPKAGFLPVSVPSPLQITLPLVARSLLCPAFLLLNFTHFLAAGNDRFPFLTRQTVPVEPPLPLLQKPPGSGKGK